jgi:ABC-type nitrate/sulfonate/bicarbonate transport system permease component
LLKNKKVLAVIPALVLLCAWEIAARTQLINPVLFPAPTATVVRLFMLFKDGLPAQSKLLMHTVATLKRLVVAFGIGASFGVLLGTLMGLSNLLYSFFNPFIAILMPIPGIALAPLFVIWFGFGDPTIIILGAMSTFFPVVYSTSAGIRSVDKQIVRAARTMGTSTLETIIEVYIPWSAAYIFNGIKLGLARGWMTVIAVEFIAASNWGLGYMIWNATEYLRSDIVYGGILVMVLIYILIEKVLIRNLEQKTIARWGMIGRE